MADTRHRRGRPSPEARGYDRNHRRLRERLAPQVAAGLCLCARCGARIKPGEPWDLGHNDQDRRLYNGPEHEACNRATAGRQAEPAPNPSEDW